MAVSSKLAPHLLPRRYIYNFPPAPYSPYTLADPKGLEYVLMDPNAVALSDTVGRAAYDAVANSPTWTLVREDQGFRLYKRRP